MKILDRYILTQITLATLLGIVVFIIVWISPEILFKIIRQTIYGEINVSTAIKLFFLEIPEILGKAIPVGLMLGSLFVFDRLSRDSELTVIKGTGVSFKRMIIPVIFLGLIGVIGCYITYDKLIPYSNSSIQTLKDDVNKSHFVYVDKSSTGRPKQILIVGNYDGKNIENIKLLVFSGQISESTPLIQTIIIADSAKYAGDHWKLEHGMEYKINFDGIYKDSKYFSAMNIFTADSAQKSYKILINSAKKASEMSTKELENYITLLKSVDIQDEYRYMLNKYHQRFAQSFSCILLVLCGVVLGFSKPRDKRVMGFTIGVIIIFLYYLIVPFLEMLAQTGAMLPIIAAWVPNILVFLAILALAKYKQV